MKSFISHTRASIAEKERSLSEVESQIQGVEGNQWAKQAGIKIAQGLIQKTPDHVLEENKRRALEEIKNMENAISGLENIERTSRSRKEIEEAQAMKKKAQDNLIIIRQSLRKAEENLNLRRESYREMDRIKGLIQELTKERDALARKANHIKAEIQSLNSKLIDAENKLSSLD